MARRTATVITQALPSAGERLGAMLVVIEGPDLGRYLAIDDDVVVVGSSVESTTLQMPGFRFALERLSSTPAAFDCARPAVAGQLCFGHRTQTTATIYGSNLLRLAT